MSNSLSESAICKCASDINIQPVIAIPKAVLENRCSVLSQTQNIEEQTSSSRKIDLSLTKSCPYPCMDQQVNNEDIKPILKPILVSNQSIQLPQPVLPIQSIQSIHLPQPTQSTQSMPAPPLLVPSALPDLDGKQLPHMNSLAGNTNQSVSVPALDSALPQPTLESALPKPTLPQPTLDSALPQPTLDSALPEPSLESALPQPVLESSLPKPTLPQPTLESALPQPTLESALPKPTLDSALPKPALESSLS